MRISDWSSDVCSSDLLKSFHDHIGIAMLQRVGQPFRRYIIQRGWNFFRSRPVIAVHYRCGHCCHDLSRVFICASLDNAMCGWPRSVPEAPKAPRRRAEEHTSELQSLMRITDAVFCLNKTNHT